MKSIRRFAIATTCCSFLLASACFVSGCAQEQPVESPTSMKIETSGSPATSAAVHPVIGAGDTTVQVTNETGSDIVGLRIKPASQESYDTQNSFDGFVFSNGETVDLCFDKVAGATGYDVVLLTAEDSKIAVRGIALADSKDLTFRFEDGIGFVSYVDAVTGQTVDNRASAIDAEENATVVPDDLKTQQG